MGVSTERSAVEARFKRVFDHLGLITAYARRRGAQDPEALAAEVMAIAWRRLADVPRDDARPWLIATARNLLLAERRRRAAVADGNGGIEVAAPSSPEVELDPGLEHALASLSMQDREALLLIAWEDLTPALAAASLGISAAAFRVRLHRARKRLINQLERRSDFEAFEHRHPNLERV